MKFEPLGNGFGLWVSDNHIFGTDAILLSNFAGVLLEILTEIGKSEMPSSSIISNIK